MGINNSDIVPVLAHVSNLIRVCVHDLIAAQTIPYVTNSAWCDTRHQSKIPVWHPGHQIFGPIRILYDQD